MGSRMSRPAVDVAAGTAVLRRQSEQSRARAVDLDVQNLAEWPSFVANSTAGPSAASFTSMSMRPSSVDDTRARLISVEPMPTIDTCWPSPTANLAHCFSGPSAEHRRRQAAPISAKARRLPQATRLPGSPARSPKMCRRACVGSRSRNRREKPPWSLESPTAATGGARLRRSLPSGSCATCSRSVRLARSKARSTTLF